MVRGKIEACVPHAANGFGLIMRRPNGDPLFVDMLQAVDQIEFTQAWYALGGMLGYDSDGYAYDPLWLKGY